MKKKILLTGVEWNKRKNHTGLAFLDLFMKEKETNNKIDKKIKSRTYKQTHIVMRQFRERDRERWKERERGLQITDRPTMKSECARLGVA